MKEQIDLKKSGYFHQETNTLNPFTGICVARTQRGKVQVKDKFGNNPSGFLLIPFHYGYWNHPDHKPAVHESTIKSYNSVTEQPFFKYTAAKIKIT